MAENTKIHLKSTENDVIETTLKCALMSHTIKDMLDAIGGDSEICLEVPVETVSTKILKVSTPPDPMLNKTYAAHT